MDILCRVLAVICLLETMMLIWIFKRNRKERTIEDIINFFRNMWGSFVFYVIATSIIGLFLGSIYFEKIIGLNEINTWVGIVLGLVALIIGIISLFLSFYNVDQANQTQEKTVTIIEEFRRDMVDRMNDLQHELERKIEASAEKTDAKIDKMSYVNSAKASINTDASIQWEES